ncbi:LacI family transcriptional regulator [Chitinophaga parva]|uniref:LacI family transcriptional regulator n=1 Tax=Chitinophaga parva TaxID=2169414 RepID=A0A2T7BII2_9BACT|nr:LacI family DNA-binding transcriptional regulator [Chitinophaga parva]PUZ26096.1 LacI family transcriptional regulator [Chitinophaga parva]
MNLDTITIRDIARELKLSVSTVSKALRDSYEISEKTKKLVSEYAAAHNYRPNPIAQSLKKGQSKSVGIVVSSVDNQFYSQVINGIESVAYKEGYNIFITQTHESFDLELKNVTHLTHRSIDGLLISLSSETKDVEHLQALHKKGLPIVFFDRVTDDINTHKVIVDNFNGAYNATLHLLQSGYKRIAHITSPAQLSITGGRLNGYKQALTDNGIAVDERYIKYCMHGGKDFDEIEQAVNELLAMKERPDAIFTASDRITTSVLSLLHKNNIAIPQQVALLGFTNTLLGEVLNPSLSTVVQPAFEIGKQSMELLLGIIKSKHPVTKFETRVLPTALFERNSSRRS